MPMFQSKEPEVRRKIRYKRSRISRWCFCFIVVFIIIECYIHLVISRRYYYDEDKGGTWRFETELSLRNPMTNKSSTITINWESSGPSENAILEKEKISYVEYLNANRSHPCSLTGVVMDPRLPILHRDGALWGSIESLIKNGPADMCLLIQTSSCISDKISSANGIHEKSVAAFNEIVDRSLPLLKKFMKKSGRVRISFINHTKYKLRSCKNFITPTHAWLNYHYWVDEFISDVDNDMVLMIQDDTVLCHSLNIDKWLDVAYVGAPWPNVHESVRKPSQCEHLQRLWAKWNKNNSTSTDLFCSISNKGFGGAFGNGGLSLRSRLWMQTAILSCPHVKYSGVKQKDISKATCKVNQSLPEDLYFSTVLRGIQAPLPTAFEASLFSSEMIFPEEVALQWYGPKNYKTLETFVQRRLEKKDTHRFAQFWNYYYSNISTTTQYLNLKQSQKPHFVSIGLHNIWLYHKSDFLLSLSDPVQDSCQYFRYILPLQNIPESLRLQAYKFGVNYHK